MKKALLIAGDELRLMRRNHLALLAIALLVILTFIAALTAWTHQQSIADLRARFQTEANAAFENQPDRHPHRVVHYGHFIFRPLGPLAAFDPGVDAFTGNAMFLEGHRQNSANFGDARQSSLLIRFGQLTPAFVLQTLAPLLMIFLGYGAVAREREKGTLRQMLMQGVTPAQLLAGKGMSLGLVAALILLPAMATFLFVAGQPGASAGPMAVIIIGYALYLALWVLITLLVSAFLRRSRDALLALLAVWAVTVILLPRVAPDIADAAQPALTRLETDIAIQHDLRQIGDSHDPNDPFFAAFRQKVLDQYGVEHIEDLPVNYKGLVAIEGEKLTSGLFDRYADEAFAAQQAQSRIMDAFGPLSPAIALRRLSMSAAGTDLAGHQRFLEQAEAYRYDLVQRLNRLQAEAVTFADDTAKGHDAAAEKRSRVDAGHWNAMPEFRFEPAPPGALTKAAMPGLAVLAVWFGVLMLALVPASRFVRKGHK